MSASSSMTRSSRRRRRARRGEPSQSPSVTALPKGEPLASRSWSCWTSEVFCNRERPGSAVSIHGCNTNAAANESRARHLAPHRAQANSRAGPVCQCLALRERWQCAALTERVSPAAASRFPGGRHPVSGDGAVLPTAAAVHPPPSPVLRPAAGPRGGGGRPVRWRGTAQSTALYNPARQTPPSLSGWG
jgi:hypothetical protein